MLTHETGCRPAIIAAPQDRVSEPDTGDPPDFSDGLDRARLERMAQIRFDACALLRAAAKLGIEDLQVVASRLLGLVHRSVGQLNPLRRAGAPIEKARMALFLASDAASYVNGQAFPVDGGLSSSHPIVPPRM